MNRLLRTAPIALLAILVSWEMLSWEIQSARLGHAAPPEFGAPGAAGPANEITSFKGSLKNMRRGLMIVEKEDGSEAMVMPPDNIASFKFVAQATPAFLRPNMLVRFTGNFGPGGVPLQPIEKITLFQPVDMRSIQGHAREQFTPGVHSADRRAPRNQPMVGKLTVVGNLMGLAPNGVLAVRAGKYPLRVPVSGEAEFEICYNNPTLAQPGDTVSVSGFYQPPNENQVKADRITITTDRVYGEYQPEDDRKSRRKKRGEAAAADAEDREDAEADADRLFGGAAADAKPAAEDKPASDEGN